MPRDSVSRRHASVRALVARLGVVLFLVPGGLALPGLPALLEAGPSQAKGSAKKPSVETGSINPDGYTSARVCGRCHVDIYNSWKNSLHAFSLTDPIFDAAYMNALKEGGEEAKRLCLRCHAPMTLMNKDYDLKEGVTREGVSCDFCHTVKGVDLNRPENPYDIDLSAVKRSVLKKAASPAHDVAFSELHGTAEFCAGCHNYVTPGGAAVLSTYDEWLDGPYSKEGKPCQSCHMVLGSGSVVSDEVMKSRNHMHLHDLIHDTDQLRGAMEIQIVKAERHGDNINVHVRVANTGSGHKIPTGMPSREIVLTVTAESDGRTNTQERHYRKEIRDADGNIRSEDWEAILYGATVANDNRIGPREERIERFQFYVRDGRPVNLRAVLSYRYRPAILQTRQMDIEMNQAAQTVR